VNHVSDTDLVKVWSELDLGLEDSLVGRELELSRISIDAQEHGEIYVNLANRINLTGVNQLWVADASLIAAQIRELGVGRILYHCGGGRLRRDASDLNFAFAFFLFLAQSCAQKLYWALASFRLFGGRETVVTRQSIRSFHVERTYSSVRQLVDPLGYQVVSAS
jgi:hypothetical protein